MLGLPNRVAGFPRLIRNSQPPAVKFAPANRRLPGGESAHGQGKERRKERRQEVRGEEWSEGDERHGRLSREVAVEHRGSDRDTRRNQRSDPGRLPSAKSGPAKPSPEARATANPTSFEILFIAAN
jgi:hypothetical protein